MFVQKSGMICLDIVEHETKVIMDNMLWHYLLKTYLPYSKRPWGKPMKPTKKSKERQIYANEKQKKMTK